jgi:hypothetical protein
LYYYKTYLSCKSFLLNINDPKNVQVVQYYVPNKIPVYVDKKNTNPTNGEQNRAERNIFCKSNDPFTNIYLILESIVLSIITLLIFLKYTTRRYNRTFSSLQEL